MNATSLYGMFLGGAVIASLGALSEYAQKNELPNTKSVMRDFLIGSILVLFVLQVLPESVSTIFSYLPSFQSLQESLPTMSTSSSDPDLQVGPARF